MNLPDDERQLAIQVTHLLANDYDNEIFRRVYNHSRIFEDDRKARLAQRKQERAAAQAASRRARLGREKEQHGLDKA